MVLYLMIFKAFIFTIVLVLALDVRRSSKETNEMFTELLELYGVDEAIHEAGEDSVELDSEARTTVSDHVQKREELFDERIAKMKSELDSQQEGGRKGTEAGITADGLYNIDHAEHDQELISNMKEKEEYSE